MVGEILDLRLQVDNAVVRHVRHFLYIAVLAELISVGEITTIFLPVNPRKLLWRIECSFVIAVRKLTFVLVLLMMLKYVLHIGVIVHQLFTFVKLDSFGCRTLELAPFQRSFSPYHIIVIIFSRFELLDALKARFVVIFVIDMSTSFAYRSVTLIAVEGFEDCAVARPTSDIIKVVAISLDFIWHV